MGASRSARSPPMTSARLAFAVGTKLVLLGLVLLAVQALLPPV